MLGPLPSPPPPIPAARCKRPGAPPSRLSCSCSQTSCPAPCPSICRPQAPFAPPFQPNATAAELRFLLAVVATAAGRKRWALYPPGRVPPGVELGIDDDGQPDFQACHSVVVWAVVRGAWCELSIGDDGQPDVQASIGQAALRVAGARSGICNQRRQAAQLPAGSYWTGWL